MGFLDMFRKQSPKERINESLKELAPKIFRGQYKQITFAGKMLKTMSGGYLSEKSAQTLFTTIGYTLFSERGIDKAVVLGRLIDRGQGFVDRQIAERMYSFIYDNIFRATQAFTSYESIPGFAFSHDTGDSCTEAIKVVLLVDKNIVRKALLDAFGSSLPQEMRNNPEVLDGFAAENAKMSYLHMLYGPDSKWSSGDRAYYEGSIQSQEINFSDGASIMLFFDFSQVHIVA